MSINLIDDLKKIIKQGNYDLPGCYGAYQHYEPYFNELRDLFTFKKPIQREAEEKFNINRNNNKPVVAIHYRRGDYLLVSSLNLQDDYYKKTLSFFPSQSFQFMVFSDDIPFCKTLPYLQGKTVTFSEGTSKEVDMQIISLCDHAIIANSSFSLWGALLNRKDNKTVICPYDYMGPSAGVHTWFNGNYFPKQWQAIKG